ncbi:MAG: hypothetical protein ABIJ17_01505 [Patescibacteria group bacterium]
MKKKDKFFVNNKTGIGTTTINYSGYGYGKHYAGMTNVYGYAPDGSTFDYIVTYHRSNVIIKMIKSGEWWKIDESIRSNYTTNGYTTRVGIKKASKKRCEQLRNSHAVISHSGKLAHDERVRKRNNY